MRQLVGLFICLACFCKSGRFFSGQKWWVVVIVNHHDHKAISWPLPPGCLSWSSSLEAKKQPKPGRNQFKIGEEEEKMLWCSFWWWLMFPNITTTIIFITTITIITTMATNDAPQPLLSPYSPSETLAKRLSQQQFVQAAHCRQVFGSVTVKKNLIYNFG